MKKILVLIFFLPILGLAQLYDHSFSGIKINHNYFSLSYSEIHEQAEWVYYVLNNKSLLGKTKRTNNFRSDDKVITGSSKTEDYKRTGYDRGHLVPASDMKISHTAMSESFLMSNISPQEPSFNRGGWKKLEFLVRSWAKNHEIHIVTAGILNFNLSKLGKSDVSIPNFFYKIIYVPSEKKMIGFVMPNTKIDSDLKKFVKSVDEIELLTGVDFFFNLPDEDENLLESNVNLSDWNFGTLSKSSPFKKNYYSSNSISTQCIGYAKSTGKRCRNKTKNTNQYCYIHQSQSSDYKEPKKTKYVGRCNAITKAGNRCKRNASSGSRYCWQH